MNIKKEALDRIKFRMEQQLQKIQWKLRENKNTINSTAKDQKVLKQERRELVKLMRILKGVEK